MSENTNSLLCEVEQIVFDMLCEAVFLSRDVAGSIERLDLADRGEGLGGRDGALYDLLDRSARRIYDSAFALSGVCSAKAEERQGKDMSLEVKSLAEYYGEIRRKLNGIRAEFESLSNPRTGEWWNDSSERGGRTD